MADAVAQNLGPREIRELRGFLSFSDHWQCSSGLIWVQSRAQ
jgi:hypothetical protein